MLENMANEKSSNSIILQFEERSWERSRERTRERFFCRNLRSRFTDDSRKDKRRVYEHLYRCVTRYPATSEKEYLKV